MDGRVARERMDVERLVHWALGEQGLGWASERSTEDFADYGTRIDTGGSVASPSIALLTDDDALVVKAAIDGLPGKARALVLQFGRSGTRPDGADEPMPEPQQLRNKKGELMWEYDGEGKSRERDGRVTGPKIDWASFSREKELVEFGRAQWAVWWEALRALVGPLNNRLATHFCTGPGAPKEPWLLAKPVVFGPDGVPLGSLRGAAPGELGLVSGEEADERRVPAWRKRLAAQAPIVAKAGDWSAPERPPVRRRPRVANRPVAVAGGGGTGGGA